MSETAADHDAFCCLVETLDHEVRSPLTLVYGWAEIVLDSVRSGDSADVLLLTHLSQAVAGVTEHVVQILEESTRRLGDGEHVGGGDLLAIVQQLRLHHGA